MDDLVIFKYFRLIFSLEKKTTQFPLSFNLYFQLIISTIFTFNYFTNNVFQTRISVNTIFYFERLVRYEFAQILEIYHQIAPLSFFFTSNMLLRNPLDVSSTLIITHFSNNSRVSLSIVCVCIFNICSKREGFTGCGTEIK